MTEQERIQAVWFSYKQYVKDDSPYFKMGKQTCWCFFEKGGFNPPYEKLSSLEASLPLEHLVFSELRSIVADICNYQNVRDNRWFASGELHDVTNVVLEELKAWCHAFRIDRDVTASIAEMDKRLQYVRALRSTELFPSRSWTRCDDETMIKVLYRTEQALLEAKEKLTQEHNVTQLRDRLTSVEVGLNTLKERLIYYLTFILRDTPHLSVSAGDSRWFQRETSEIEAFRKTATGEALFQLMKAPLMQEASHPHALYQPGLESKAHQAVSASANPYLMLTSGRYTLKEEALEALRKSKKLLGLEPVIVKNHEEALKHFLILHGLLYELARIQLFIKTTSTLASMAGQLALIKLYPMTQVMMGYYQWISQSIEGEVKGLNAIVTKVADDKVVFKKNKASDTWITFQKRAKDFIAPLFKTLQDLLEQLVHIAKLSYSGRQEHVAQEALTLANVLTVQAHFMSQCLPEGLEGNAIRMLSHPQETYARTSARLLLTSPQAVPSFQATHSQEAKRDHHATLSHTSVFGDAASVVNVGSSFFEGDRQVVEMSGFTASDSFLAAI